MRYCSTACQKAARIYHKHTCFPQVNKSSAIAMCNHSRKLDWFADALSRRQSLVNVETVDSAHKRPSVDRLRHQLHNQRSPVDLRNISVEEGIGVVATEKIGVGDLVLVDEPVASTPQAQYQKLICHCCFRPLNSKNYECLKCDSAVWCSQTCKEKAATLHQVECEVLQRFPRTTRERLHGVRLFVLLATSQQSVKDLIGASEFRNRTSESKERDKLVGMATGILSSLPTKYSHNTGVEDIIDFIMAVKVNGFTISDIEGRRLGSGYYCLARFLNHSCAPNVIVGFDGGQLQARAVREILIGEECTISYTELYRPLALRRQSLYEKKNFHCRCRKCLTDDACYPEVPELISGYKCTQKRCLFPVGTAQQNIVCALCNISLKDSKSSLSAIVSACTEARERATQALGQGNLTKTVEITESALRATEGKLHPFHFERFECHVLIVDACHQMKPLPRQKLFGHVKMALVSMENIFINDSHNRDLILNPRAARMWMLLGTCYESTGKLGVVTAPLFDMAAKAYGRAEHALRGMWGVHHASTIRAQELRQRALESVA